MGIMDLACSALFDLMRRRVANSTASGIWVECVEFEIVDDLRGCIVRATYRLRFPETAAGGGIAFDLSETPLILLKCTPRSGLKNDVTMNRSAVWLTIAENTDSAMLVLDLLWPWSEPTAPTGLDFLLLPDFLPILLRPDDSRTYPQPKLAIVTQTDRVHIAGQVRTGNNVGDDAFLQVMLAREGAITDDASEQSIMSLSGGFAAILSDGERQRVRNLLVRIFEHLKRYLECDVPCHFCVVTPAELGEVKFQPMGMCIVATPDAFGLGAADAEPVDFALASIIAGVWWCAGCRFVGRGAKELQLALQS